MPPSVNGKIFIGIEIIILNSFHAELNLLLLTKNWATSIWIFSVSGSVNFSELIYYKLPMNVVDWHRNQKKSPILIDLKWLKQAVYIILFIILLNLVSPSLLSP